jgi:hypothetical protein
MFRVVNKNKHKNHVLNITCSKGMARQNPIILIGFVFLLSSCTATATPADYVRQSVANPESSIDGYNAGTALIAAEDYALANEMLARAATQSDNPRDVLFNLGVARFKSKDFRGAAAAYQTILRANPSDADARYNYELSLFYVENSLPEDQQQLTEPELGETDPTITPTPQPGGLDGPTPTPPREEFEPDLTKTPEGGSGDFASDAESTPVPRVGGGLTIEEAMRLLDGQDTSAIAPYLFPTPAGGVNEENDW